MRSRVAIAIAKREREKLGRVVVIPPPKAKKSTKAAKAEIEAPVVTEDIEEVIAEDPKTLEEPGG